MPTPEELLAQQPPDPMVMGVQGVNLPPPPGGGSVPPPFPPVTDELAGAPFGPPPMPEGQPPPEYPPKAWFGAPPPVADEVEGAPEAPAFPESEVKPPAAAQQAGPQAMAALDQARAQGMPEEQREAQLSPEERYAKHMGEAENAQEKALQAKADTEKQQNEALASGGMAIAANAIRQQDAADKEYFQTYQAARQKRQELDAEAERIANSPIDRKRAFRDMGMGAKIGLAITAFLNGMTTRAVTTGQNPMTSMLNQMVEDDMKAQEMDLENRTRMLGVRRGLLADDLEQGKSLLEARYKSIATANKLADQYLQAYALQFNNPAIDARVAAERALLKADYDAKGLGFTQDLHKQFMDDMVKRAQIGEINARTAKERAALHTGPPGEKAADINARREMEKDRRERLVMSGQTEDGRQLYAPRPEVATKVNTKIAGANKGVAAVDELAEIYERHGWQPLGAWDPDEKASRDYQRANTLTKDLMATYSLEKGQGTIRESEYKMYEEMIGKPGGWVDPSRGSLAAMRELFINDVNDSLADEAALDEQGNVIRPKWWQPRPRLKKPDDSEDANDRSLTPLEQGPNGEIVETGTAKKREEEKRREAEKQRDFEKRDAAKIKPGNYVPPAPKPRNPDLVKAEEMDRLYGTNTAAKWRAEHPGEE